MKYKLTFICIIFLVSCSLQGKKDIALYRAYHSGDSIQSQDDAKFEKKDSILMIKTTGNGKLPGIKIVGKWDLSQNNKLLVELENRESRGDLPITIRLSNPNADVENNKGIFIDRVKIPSNCSKQLEIRLPPQLSHPEVAEKFSGMKKTPYYPLPGIVSDINPANIIEVALYINKPTLDWEWGVKSIIASVGENEKLPNWLSMSPEVFYPFIDKYGQFIHKDWPGKTKNDYDLKKDLQEEISDLKLHSGPSDRNKYGGWKNGPKQKATGQFYVAKIDNKWWMVDPEGYLFWSHGAVRASLSSGITPLDNREFYFKDLPQKNDPEYGQFYTLHDELLYPYYLKREIKETYNYSAANIMRKYGDNWKDKFANIVHKRFKSWGLNTIANSSDKYICMQERTPYCERFEIKSPAIEGNIGAGWWWDFRDPFHPEFSANVHQQMLERKHEIDDPWCLGLFVDNELGWGSDTDLAIWTLKSSATQPAKIEMIKFLKERYNTVSALNQQWKSGYENWDALQQSKDAPSLTDAKKDLIDFSNIVVETYFKNVRREFKKVAPNKLYMGCRFAGTARADVLKIAAKYCDVLSYNIYRFTLDDFKLPEGIDKPVMVGEFHFGALDRGMFHPGLVETANQEERAKAYAAYVESALRHPNFIGTHWHQYSDQATTGRFDGENLQVGLTDICDKPYPETIKKVREVGYNMYSIRSGK